MKMTPQQAATEIVRFAQSGTPIAIIPIGVPGSGKSSFVKILRERYDTYGVKQFTVASTDDLIDKWAESNGMTYSQAWDKCPMKDFNRQFKEEIELAVLMKNSIFIDRTNMGKKTRRGHLAMISGDYKKYCLNFDVDTKTLKERLELRAQATGKIITPMVLGSMLKNFEAPTRDEGFDVIITVDNGKTCSQKIAS